MAKDSKHGNADQAEDTGERRYRSTQDAFRDLPLSQQTRFLIEATATTVARGLEAVARSVADEMDEAFRDRPGQQSKHDADGHEAASDDASAKPEEGSASAEDAAANEPHSTD